MLENFLHWANEIARFLVASLGVAIPILLISLPFLLVGWLGKLAVRRMAIEESHKELGREEATASWDRERRRRFGRHQHKHGRHHRHTHQHSS